MQLDPSTGDLFTDSGEHIKQLRCPMSGGLLHLEELPNNHYRMCAGCRLPVLNTAALSDEAVLQIVREDPSTCLSVSSDQPNVSMVGSGGISIFARFANWFRR